jgi:hypothetical protein
MIMQNLANSLRELLKKNIVLFTYEKKDGTIRHARGTRNLAIAEVALNATIAPPKTDRVNENAYFDLDKGEWRSFIPENLISIDGILAVTPVPKAEEPIREIPVSRGVGAEMPFPKPSKEEIRETMDKLDKDIDIPTDTYEKLAKAFGLGGGMPIVPIGVCKEEKPIVVGIPTHQPNGGGMPINGKVGTPIQKPEGIALPFKGEEMTIDDFAKLVAKYVVAELVGKLAK